MISGRGKDNLMNVIKTMIDYRGKIHFSRFTIEFKDIDDVNEKGVVVGGSLALWDDVRFVEILP